MAGELLRVADELYGLDLAEFTPARDAKVRELKADRELAAAVKALRKPSLAAWTVNLLVRREAGQVEQVLEVGAALREAQTRLQGEELRALTRQRRQLTAAVTTRARALAAERGVRVTPAVADQVEASLTAAILDEGCARAVRSGQLVTALSATGVGGADPAGAVATPEALGFAATPVDEVPPPAPDLRVVPDPDAAVKARRAAEDALAEAEDRLAAATEARAAAVRDVSDLEARSLEVQAGLDEVRRRLAELETALEEVDEELADAEEVRAEADAAVAAATRERDAAVAALSRLR